LKALVSKFLNKLKNITTERLVCVETCRLV